MSSIAYPFRVVDNSGVLVSGATITIGAVALTVNVAANVPGAKNLATGGSLNGSTGISVTYQDFSNGDYVLVYDPESFGEAYVPIVPSKGGSTITGANALIGLCCTKDSSRITTALPNAAPAASGGLPSVGTSAGQINPASGKIPATLAASDVTGNVPGDIQTIKTQTITAASGVTFPSSIASPTNITAGTIGSVSGSVNSVANPVTTTFGMKKNTALSNFTYVMFNNGVPTAGLTVTGFVSLDGAAETALTNASTGITNGAYKVNLAAADVNCNTGYFRFHATGAQDTILPFITQS